LSASHRAGFATQATPNLSVHPLAVKLQPGDDLVDHLALGARREACQIEFGTGKLLPSPCRRGSVQRLPKVCSHHIVFVGLIGDHKIRGADPGKAMPEIEVDARRFLASTFSQAFSPPMALQ
jgi:hypothetical protein